MGDDQVRNERKRNDDGGFLNAWGKLYVEYMYNSVHVWSKQIIY